MTKKMHIISLICLVIIGLTYQSSSKTQAVYRVSLIKPKFAISLENKKLIDSVRGLHYKVDSLTHHTRHRLYLLNKKKEQLKKQNNELEGVLVRTRY